MVYERAETWHEHSCHFCWFLLPLALLVKGFSARSLVQFSVCALRSTTMSSVFAPFEYVMLCPNTAPYSPMSSFLILQNMAINRELLKMPRCYAVFQVCCQRLKREGDSSVLWTNCWLLCDTVLQVHCGLPVMLFYSPGQKGASACIAACFPLNKTGWISKQNVKQKTAWPSQCLPAFSGEWRHGLASKCILISCWYWWANWWESRSCLT